jgi:DNA-binding beta-propeller fold protein YncE
MIPMPLSGTAPMIPATAVSSKGLTVLSKTIVASGYQSVPNAAALILGPTGLAYDGVSDTLYVASTGDNAIYAIAQAGHRTTAVTLGDQVFAGPPLRGPLALRWAPNGDLLAANGDAVNAQVRHPSEIVEFTVWGQFIREYNVDSSQGGAFGIDTVLDPDALYNYAVIDDVTNNLLVTHIRAP